MKIGKYEVHPIIVILIAVVVIAIIQSSANQGLRILPCDIGDAECLSAYSSYSSSYYVSSSHAVTSQTSYTKPTSTSSQPATQTQTSTSTSIVVAGSSSTSASSSQQGSGGLPSASVDISLWLQERNFGVPNWLLIIIAVLALYILYKLLKR